MKGAAKKGFPPALLDSATLFWMGWGVQAARDRRILIVLNLASRVRHQASGIWRYAAYRSGNLGVVLKVVGSVLFPLARLRYALAVWRSPFAAQVFLFEPVSYLIRQEKLQAKIPEEV
jgi:hypothetical protein